MTLEEERVAFYYELGRSLAKWSDIEEVLKLTVGIFLPVGEKDHAPARALVQIGFVSIEGFWPKLKFANGYIGRALAGNKYLADWEDLFDRLRAQSQMRNTLAHWVTDEYQSHTPGQRIALRPWIISKRSPKDRPPEGAMCVMAIVKARLQFEALMARQLNFLHRILQQPEPFLKSDEQEADPPTIDTIMRQIHEELGHQRLSSRDRNRLEDARNAAASLTLEPPQGKADDEQQETKAC